VAGMVPLTFALCTNHFEHACTGDRCMMLCVPACTLGGLIAGLAVGAMGHRGRHGFRSWNRFRGGPGPGPGSAAFRATRAVTPNPRLTPVTLRTTAAYPLVHTAVGPICQDRELMGVFFMSRSLTCLVVLAAATALEACTGDHEMGDMHDMDMLPDVIEVPPSEGRFETEVAEDLDPSPDVVDVSLEARVADVELAPGRRVPMWTYNGTLPGPRIEARVGNTVRIRFKNSLPEATTIHWHGIRVPAAMDGVPAAQAPIAPGAEFTYEFVVPDAGTFWYHPHIRSDEQVERGLYGAFVVRGDDEPDTTTDRTVVLDDMLVNADWTLREFDPMHAMVGRQGNLILTNGRAHPIAPVERGGLHRFRFINAANARYFRLTLPGHRLIQIGSDGGLLTAPFERDDLLLVPGERVDVVVTATGDEGEALDWKTLRYNRGHGTGNLPDAVVFQMRNDEAAPVSTPPVPASLATIPELPRATVQRELRLEESMGGGAHAGHGSGGAMMAPVFSINGQVYPDATPLRALLETVEEWSIVNTTEMDHPFHLHGFRFQVVSENGVAPGFTAWRDSINVPAEQTVVFRVRLEDHPGTWMFHCHILEHAEHGMMGELEVEEP
jgi:FtsP/CotA-like multicopper oxidase with cupredoxin domain